MVEISRALNVTRIDAEGAHEQPDEVIREHPLTVMINGQEIATLMCLPERVEDLTACFLFAEGLVKTREDILSIHIRLDGTYADVELSSDFNLPEDFFEERIIGSGCGKGSFSKGDLIPCHPLDENLELSYTRILEWMAAFQEQSEVFRRTGGVHAAGLAGPDGLLNFAEDIGRHNAVDKIIGALMMQGGTIHDKAMCTSGRISTEILSKCVKSGIGVIVSRSAPTDRAVEMAEQMNVLLIGFVRAKRMNVYTFPERVKPT